MNVCRWVRWVGSTGSRGSLGSWEGIDNSVDYKNEYINKCKITWSASGFSSLGWARSVIKNGSNKEEWNIKSTLASTGWESITELDSGVFSVFIRVGGVVNLGELISDFD